MYCRLPQPIHCKKAGGRLQHRKPNKNMHVYICSEYRLPSKIVSDVGTYFVSEKFETSTSGSAYITWYHLNITIKAGDKQKCIKFAKRTMKKCDETNIYIYIYIDVFITGKVNTDQPRVTDPGDTPV